MEARTLRTALVAVVVSLLPVAACWAASHRTPNFIINAPTREFAQKVGESAEQYRRDLATEWLGKELPRWAQPCPITVEVGPQLGAGGATSFNFDRGEVFGWQMNIQGPADRLLDSVLPHEITHTIFASHFRQPLPRWADEGACTTVEHKSERSKQDQMLIEFLHTDRGIAFSKMFAMTQYPQDVMPLYSQGYSLARFLIAQGGQRKYIAYIGDGLESQDWIGTTRKHYGFGNLAALQDTWLEWVRRGSPLPLEGNESPDSAVSQASFVNQSAPGPREVGAASRAAPAPIPARLAGPTGDQFVKANSKQPLSNSKGPVYRGQSSDAYSPREPGPVEWPATTVDPNRKYPRRTQFAPIVEPLPRDDAPPDRVDSTGWVPSRMRSSANAAIRHETVASERDSGQDGGLEGSEPAVDFFAEPSDPADLRRRVLIEWTRPAPSERGIAFDAPAVIRR